MNTMEYKGYHGSVEYSSDDNRFAGKVIGINDLIIFSGISVDELKNEFQASVDDYLAYCLKRGKTPDKEYSGHFTLRIEPELHKSLAFIAERQGVPLTRIITEACISYIKTA